MKTHVERDVQKIRPFKSPYIGFATPQEGQANRQFLLPFGIDITIEGGVTNIESSLPEALPHMSDPIEIGRIVGVVEGVEQLLLSLARVGVDLPMPRFAEAIRDCVENLQ